MAFIACVAGGLVRAESNALAVERRYNELQTGRERNEEEATEKPPRGSSLRQAAAKTWEPHANKTASYAGYGCSKSH